MLRYQESILQEILAQDGLVILGRGLGLHSILLQLLRVFGSDPSKISDTGPARPLIFFVNISKEQQEGLQDDLSTTPTTRPIRFINQEVGVGQRGKVYMEGGCVIATAQILIVDMLNGRLDPTHVSGIVVNDAHRVTETSREAFIVRLFRTANQAGFLKAFSEHAQLFSGEFQKVSKVMKSLYLRKLFLWPRFHLDVAESLVERSPDVVELVQPVTPLMADAQRAIVSTMEACLDELRAIHGGDLAHFSVEDSLGRAFDKSIRVQLASVWDKAGKKTKQLVSDLRTLQRLLEYLLRYDCVKFWQYLDTLRASEGRRCFWLAADASNKLFECAERRVYKIGSSASSEMGSQANKHDTKPRPAKQAKQAKQAKRRGATAKLDLKMILEPNPKWNLVLQVLHEIETNLREHDLRIHERKVKSTQQDASGTASVLVLCADEGACDQLGQLLDHHAVSIAKTVTFNRSSPPTAEPSREVLQRQFQEHILRKARTQAWANTESLAGSGQCSEHDGTWQESEVVLRQRRERELLLSAANSFADNEDNSKQLEPSSPSSVLFKSATAQADVDFLLDSAVPLHEQQANSLGSTSCRKIRDFMGRGAKGGCIPVLVHPIWADWRGDRLLEQVQPRFVVVYDPDPTIVRQLEVFRARHPGQIPCTDTAIFLACIGLRVYFLSYQHSWEEQHFRSRVRREKEAFEELIKEKASLLLPSAVVSLAAEAQATSAAATAATVASLVPRDSRQGGKRAAAAAAASRKQRVVVDTREFRAALPSILHARGIELLPVTLEVGDYILSPQIVVERKSIPDLFGSFASGRLYTQCDAMCRHYKTAVLLIEFEESKAFSLPLGKISHDGSRHEDLTTKLALLTMHFPTLRLVWMRSPHAAADIFTALKAESPSQPDPDKAAAIGQAAGDGAFMQGVYNWTPQEVLRRLPGVTSGNIYRIMRATTNLQELSAMDETALQQLLGGLGGTQLYEFFNATVAFNPP